MKKAPYGRLGPDFQPSHLYKLDTIAVYFLVAGEARDNQDG